MNSDRDQVLAVVGQARRRVVANQALWEATFAVTVALLGPTLLLALGRDWFAWPMLILFAAAGIALAGWRLWRRRPRLYPVAQVLDSRLRSEDQISTGICFLESEDPVAVEQRHAAASLAARSDLETAFPWKAPRSLYALASVFLVASALCAVRYWLEKPLRVERPLPEVILQALGVMPGKPGERPADQARNAPPRQRGAPAENQELTDRNGPEQAQKSSDPGAASSPEAGDQARTPADEKDSRAQNDSATPGDEMGDPLASDASGDQIQSYEEMLERDAKNGLSKAEGKQGKEGNENPNSTSAGSQESSNSLLAKLRDAMNNMLSRLQQKSPGAGQQQQGAKGASANEGEQKEGQGEGQSGAGQPQPGGQQAAQGEGGESDAQDPSGRDQGKGGGKSSDQGTRGSSSSGAGREEGDKQVRDAQQAEAMGKLSDLYGRRAANVTGEVTVETQSGKQTLRTPQGQKQARHADPGGQVSRDEIPLAYQEYVKEYFNKLHQNQAAQKK
ncbi:MAG: hypothetical protein HY238_04610 [Acidobacteria bacterium]|nr:hypothetical protein [Acidobacteriota bacterium]